MAIPFIALSAITPSLLLMWYFHSRDVYPEPPRVLWTTFGLGVLSVIPVMLVALPAARLLGGVSNAYLRGMQNAFLIAAVPEEFFKFLVLVLYCARHREFNEPMDGVIYGVSASLGFATLENSLYVAKGGISIAILRALTAVPCHAFLGAIMGYYVGQAHFNLRQPRVLLLFGAWAVPTLLHGLYDFPLLTLQSMTSGTHDAVGAGPLVSSGLVLLTLLVLIFEGEWAVWAVRRLRAIQQPHSVAVAQAAKGRSVWGWVFSLLGGLLATGGGLVTLGLGMSLALGHVEAEDLAATLIGGMVLGILPLVVGLMLFVAGIRRLNQRPAPMTPAYQG